MQSEICSLQSEISPSDMRQILPLKQMVEPHARQLLLHGVLPQARGQAREVDAVDLLILIEAREDDLFLARHRIDVLLQALRAYLLHHALHRRVAACKSAG